MHQKTQPFVASSSTSSSSTSSYSPQSIQTLHHRFAFYGRSAREWTRKCALLLPEIERERVWEKKGFGSIYEYAGKLAGMGRDAVNDALRVLRATEGMDAIREVIAQRGINAVKPVITTLTPDNESFWAEKAQMMSRHALETYVRETKKQNDVNCAGRTGPSKNLDLPLQQAIIMQLNPDVAAELEKLKGHNGDWNSLMKELLQMREKNLEQNKPEAVAAASRHIPAKIRRHVINKTRGQCVYPSCTKQYKILHHTQRFALKRIHDPERLVALCKAHERIIHNGLIENEDGPTQRWRVRLQPDERDPKYAIDQKVQMFRAPG